MICDFCKKEIEDNTYIEASALVIRNKPDFIGSINITVQEMEELTTKCYVHKNCWKELIQVKQGKKLEVT